MSEIDYLKQDVTSLNKQLDEAYQVLMYSVFYWCKFQSLFLRLLSILQSAILHSYWL